MAIRDAVFDSITNSEDKMIQRFKIRKGDACLYLRAYMMIRLFFFEEFVISDSSINLNRALRTLILEEEGKNEYGKRKYDLRNLPPADFGELIRDGSIKLAARDIYKGNFSDALRNAQGNKTRVDLPSEKYTRMIDELCKEENIYWWNADVIAQMFTTKIKDSLRDSMEMQHSDKVNVFLRDLSDRLSSQEILTYNFVKNVALKTHEETSEEYRTLYDMLRNSYDYNIPEYFQMKYLKQFKGFQQTLKKHKFEINLPEQYDISWKYSIDAYAFAMAPISYLKFAWRSGEYKCYKSARLQYMDGQISFSRFIGTWEGYMAYLDNLLVPYYNRGKGSKNIILQFNEYKSVADIAALTVKVGVWTYDMVKGIPDILSDPVTGTLNLVLTNIFPSIVSKVHERHTALPPIEHAIIKLDK